MTQSHNSASPTRPRSPGRRRWISVRGASRNRRAGPHAASLAARPGAGTMAGMMGAVMRGFLVALLLACAGLAAPAAAQQPVPALSGRVVDTTGTLDAAQGAALEAQLAAIEERHGSQVAVLVVPTTDPEPIEAYAIRVAEQWKLGRADVDDGVLLLVAMQDRRMRIEVGYGLEGAIPDAIARRIIAEQMAPRFRAGDFAGGIGAAVDAIDRAIAGEGLPPPAAGAARHDDEAATDWLSLLLFIAFGGFILTRMLGALPGALIGGAGGGFLAMQAGVSLIAGVGAGLVLFFLLLLFGAIGGLGRVGPHTYRSGSPPVIFPGGGRRGGGFGGGGFGGGGFGGGGGGFGGGGASGGW